MKDPKKFLQHILECINDIEEYALGKSKGDFLSDKMLQDAIFRKIEIIGEATKNLPEDFKLKAPHIPWRDMAGTRDKLIHGYFGVDLNLTWDIVKDDLPKLKSDLSELLKD
jgi:uncharacterized protein with HEPN domain